MRIVFMGTPEPACKILESLIKTKHKIILVVTQPDRPKGRGRKLTASPVAELANQKKLPIQKPDKADDKTFIALLKFLSPDVIVVAAYGKILPEEVLKLPKYGCLNLHASLLPKYRGAAPVQWAILQGEKVTGMTIMRLNEKLDAGDVLAQEKIKISDDDTAITLLDNLFKLGVKMLPKVLISLESNAAEVRKQKDADATYAPLLSKEEGLIDFKKTAAEIRNKIRAFTPWPGAYTFYNKKMFKLWQASAELVNLQKPFFPGKVVDIIKNCGFVVAALDKGLLIEKVQLEGKKIISADVFANGYQLKIGARLPS